jgi:hypothetical protein
LEHGPLGSWEPPLGYHPSNIGILTAGATILGTVLGGQFDWGGRLLKGNGGAQRFPQRGRKPRDECKGRRELDCEPNTASRYESRA